MALHKRGTEAKLPFPGESPTISLAVAAGHKYGLKQEEETPSKAGKKQSAAKAEPKSRPKTKSANR